MYEMAFIRHWHECTNDRQILLRPSVKDSESAPANNDGHDEARDKIDLVVRQNVDTVDRKHDCWIVSWSIDDFLELQMVT